jgi:hypothetical protein
MSKTSLTRRAALTGAPAVAVAMAGSTALAAVPPDPIFAAIDGYKAAVHARDVALNAPYVPGHEHEQDTFIAGRAEWDAFYAMFEITPTTIAGIAALLEVLGTYPYGQNSYSVLAWAYNNANKTCPADQLILRMAAMLRSLSGGSADQAA